VAVRTISTKLAIEGEDEYRNSVREINSELKTLGSELKLVESNFKGQLNSQAALTAKGDVLKRSYDSQSEKVKELNEALKNAQSAQQAYNSRIDATKAKIAANDAEMEKLKVSTLDTSEAQAKLAEKTAKLQKELEEATAKEAAAARGVNEWKRQNNIAQAELNALNAEVKQNSKYLDEAKRSTDKCATSIDNYGKQTKEAQTQSGLLSKIFAGGFFANIASNALSSLGNMLTSFGTKALATADQLKGMTAETGLSATELQKLRYIGEDVGVEVETMATSMKRIVKSMNAARDGAGEQAEAYRKLKVNVTEANGELRDGNTVYGEVLEALGKMTNETERDALAQIVLGRSATELNALIELGASGMEDLGKKAEKTGAIMSEDAVEALDATGDAIDHLKQSAESFVGETLADIIDSGKSASEIMSDLTEELGAQNNITDLIEKYRQLTAEVSDSSTNSAQLSIKTAELEQTKQALIEASNGVVTAIDIENGTFDQQVTALAKATGAERDYLEYKLRAQILDNKDSAAAEKTAAAEEKYATAKTRRDAAQARVDAAKEALASGKKRTWYGGDLEGVAESNQQMVDSYKRIMSEADTTMSGISESTAKAHSSIKFLVENGFMTAEEAAAEFGYKLDEMNVILAGTGEAVAEAVPAVADMKTQIDELSAEYEAAKDSVRSTLDSIIGGWGEVAPAVAVSADEVAANLQSQLDWMTSYRDNLDALMGREIPGVDTSALVESLSDGSAESAAILAGLATATDEQVKVIAQKFASVSTGSDAFVDEVAASQIDLDGQLAKMTDGATKAVVEDMDLSDEAKASALNTINGYINGIKGQTGTLNLTMTKAAQDALNAWKKVFDERSPSHEMEKSGKNAIKGEIIGVKSLEGELIQLFTTLGGELLDGLSIGMKDSSGKTMTTVDEIAKELASRLSTLTSLASASSDVSGLKYDLWELTTGGKATNEEKAEKQLESLKEQAELEKSQIEATQTALSKMTELYGENSDESLKLQKQLLQEQIAYEKLNQSILDVARSKTAATVDSLSDMADHEYKLWFLNNPDATDAEKLQKQSEVLALKLDMEGETVADTEEAYAAMAEQYGENSDESIKLQEELLKEKIAYAELTAQIKELNKAKAGYDTANASISTEPLQAAKVWDSVNVGKVAAATTPTTGGLTAKEVGSMMATAINAVGSIVGQKPSGDLIFEIPVNGVTICRAVIKDFRAVDKATPEVVSDKL